MPDWSFLILMGITLIILGFFLEVFGMMRSVRESEEEGYPHYKEKVKGGGVILIGPVPVIFGTDKKYALLLMILAIIIMLLAIVFLK